MPTRIGAEFDYPVLGEPIAVEFVNTLHISPNGSFDFLGDVDLTRWWFDAIDSPSSMQSMDVNENARRSLVEFRAGRSGPVRRTCNRPGAAGYGPRRGQCRSERLSGASPARVDRPRRPVRARSSRPRPCGRCRGSTNSPNTAPCRVAEMVAIVRRYRFDFGGRESKIIFDALRWELARGRVIELARGVPAREDSTVDGAEDPDLHSYRHSLDADCRFDPNQPTDQQALPTPGLAHYGSTQHRRATLVQIQLALEHLNRRDGTGSITRFAAHAGLG